MHDDADVFPVQFDAVDAAAELVSWLPKKLAPQIRCVLTMVDGSACHQNLLKRESKPQHLTVTDLQPKDRRVFCCYGLVL